MRKFYFKATARLSAATLVLSFAGGFTWAQAPANDNCSGAVQLTIGTACVPVNGTVVNAATSTGAPDPGCFNLDMRDVWFRFTPAAGQTSVNIIFGDGPGLVAQVLSSSDNTCSGAFTEIACVYNATTTDAALPPINDLIVTPGTIYFLRICRFGTANTFTVCVQQIVDPLPAHMNSLKGSLLSGGTALLSWQTYKEQNNSGFAVQRSEDGRTFSNIGWVNTKAESGNSSQTLSYRFTDKDAVGAGICYRLQQVDRDGKTTLSNVVRLGANAESGFNITASPNPVAGELTVRIKGEPGMHAQIAVTDITGKAVIKLPVTAATTKVNMTGLAKGMYLLKYTDGNQSQTLKVSRQ